MKRINAGGGVSGWIPRDGWTRALLIITAANALLALFVRDWSEFLGWASALTAWYFVGVARAVINDSHGEHQQSPEQADIEMLEGIIAQVWLYCDSRYFTKQLTTPEKERFADAVDAEHRRINADDPEFGDAWKFERWWRE